MIQTSASGDVTVGALRQALAALPSTLPVRVYADWQGAVERPLADAETQVCVCGYFPLQGVERDPNRCVLLVGEADLCG